MAVLFRGENILLFLVQMVGRQQVEQRQYKPSRRARKVPPADQDPDMPEHNLEPPRFSRRALERILNDWTGVKAMLMAGCKDKQTTGGRSAQEVMYEDQVYLNSQGGTIRLDKFTHTLLAKCNVEVSSQNKEASKFLISFIRSGCSSRLVTCYVLKIIIM